MEYTHTLENMVHEFALRVKSQFAGEIARDPAGFKKQVVRLIRRALPPSGIPQSFPRRREPGRPNDPRLDAAVRRVQQGESPKDILRSQIPDFDKMDTYGRYLAEKGLRAALARRRTSAPASFGSSP